MSEKSHAQSIADALFRMIQTAKDQGVAVDKGFRNQAMSEPDMTLTYLFLNKTDLFKIPALPMQVKRQVLRSNALAVIETRNGKNTWRTAGVHLIWSSTAPCSEVTSAGEMLEGIRIQGLAAFTAQLKAVRKSRANPAAPSTRPADEE
ncbi:MAG: hypothetical protein Q4B25_06255 [Pseudomonadota bacterium]|nr:hypothetical protein [Pseudomonadota bacterium]